MAIGDLNNDDINDIAVTNYNNKSISVFYINKNSVVFIKTIAVRKRPDGIAIHDMNNDGKNDILVSNYQALPHCASPNRSNTSRFVQYHTYDPDNK